MTSKPAPNQGVDATRPKPAGWRPPDSASLSPRGIVRLLYRGWQRRRAIAELSGLRDHELADAGITRGEAAAIAQAARPHRDLFSEMLHHLELEDHPWIQQLAYRRSLERTCATCSVRRQCGSWLAADHRSEPYPAFCQNGDEFGMMISAWAETSGVSDKFR